MHAATLRYAQTAAVENKHCGCGSVHYITIGDRRLRTVAEATGCGTLSPLYLIWDAASRRGLSRVGYQGISSRSTAR